MLFIWYFTERKIRQFGDIATNLLFSCDIPDMVTSRLTDRASRGFASRRPIVQSRSDLIRDITRKQQIRSLIFLGVALKISPVSTQCGRL